MVHNDVKHDARVLKGAASLQARGHDVKLFGLTADDSERFVLPDGIPVHLAHRDLSDVHARIERDGLPKGKESSIWMSFRIQGEILFEAVRANFDPELVHIHDHLALTAAAEYKKAFECPIIWDAHEIYEDLASIEPARALVNSSIIRENVRHVDGFITLNQSIADFYRDKYPELPEAALVPNAVERASRAKYDGRLHDKAGLARDQKILLFQGGYSLRRGIPALLEASRSLRDDWSLVFMGWGKLEAEIRAYADRTSGRGEGRAPVAMVPGAPHDELLSWTAGATLGTIPYENTGLNHLYCSPNKLWEYPAAGVPVLASDMPEMKRKIDRYGIGLTIDRALDPGDIAVAVNELSSEDLATMRRNCASFVAAESWQNYEGRVVELYARLGNGRGSRASEVRRRWKSISRRLGGR
ncbi:glycosyltransferase [Brachybacterium sp. GCM10030268]|uniref:glycosyltransferase n=1 Tax=Brachybacterium sp. GCM10030268 TaxID=3273382 RepID=UPI003611B7EC